MSETTTLTQKSLTQSERFAIQVEKQYSHEVGQLQMTEYDRTLAQHLFVSIDAALIAAEKERVYSGKRDMPEITWQNINMRKLTLDAVNRVQLGLDALIPGTVYPIAYLNGKTKQYGIDLRIGYKGELYYMMHASLRPLKDIRVELVYDTDKLTVYKKGLSVPKDGYDFEISSPFARGQLIGGFAYIEYEDDTGNELVVMSKEDIDKIKATAKGDKFWGKWYEEMAYKTLVHRAAKKITIDPRKINVTAYAKVEADELPSLPQPEDDAPEALPSIEMPQQEPEAEPEAIESEAEPF